MLCLSFTGLEAGLNGLRLMIIFRALDASSLCGFCACRHWGRKLILCYVSCPLVLTFLLVLGFREVFYSELGVKFKGQKLEDILVLAVGAKIACFTHIIQIKNNSLL